MNKNKTRDENKDRPVIIRSTEEIETVLNICSDHSNDGIRAYPGMSYEDGITEFWRWLTESKADPLFP